VHKSEKERVVGELTDRLKESETLIVADYRGLTMTDIDDLRGKLLEHGARFSVVKNTLGRIAAKESGNDALLALLEGPTAIAFLEADGDMVAVAKALADSARTTRILTIRGGVLQGKVISGDDVGELAKLPPLDVLRGQVIGAIIAPLNAIAGLINAPLQNLYGLIDARIEQLEQQGDTSAAPAETEPAAEEVSATEPVSDTSAPAEETTDEVTQEDESDGSS
jgi:large subunit ribosomal protein L10